MPKIVNIPADAESPASPSVGELEKELKSATKERDRIRQERIKVRESTPKPKLADALSETDQAYVDAIDTVNEFERHISRLRGRESRRVSVGSASSSEKGDS